MVSLFRGKSDMLILLNVSCLNSYQRGWGKLYFKLNNQIVFRISYRYNLCFNLPYKYCKYDHQKKQCIIQDSPFHILNVRGWREDREVGRKSFRYSENEQQAEMCLQKVSLTSCTKYSNCQQGRLIFLLSQLLAYSPFLSRHPRFITPDSLVRSFYRNWVASFI